MESTDNAYSDPRFAEVFKAYDIRGLVGQGLDKARIYAIGRAVATEVIELGLNDVLLGRDGRVSSPELARALCKGLQEGGCNVIDLGVVPSPVLYFMIEISSVASGVMVTASHNPPHYNGVKVVLNREPWVEGKLQALYQRILKQTFSEGQGRYQTQSVTDDYIKAICKDIVLARAPKIVIDCGHGVSSVVAPKCLRALGCEVVELFCDVDGRFPVHSPDPSVPSNLKWLQARVLSERADIGFAFDGDGDRCGVITNQGEIIWPDRQLMLFAVDMLKRHPGAEVIFDVKSSRYLEQVIKAHGGRPLMWKTGHSLLRKKMKVQQAWLAGEMSGHIFFKERWYGFDDGLYTAVRLLELLMAKETSVHHQFESLPCGVSTPEIKLPMEESNKKVFMEHLLKKAQFKDAQYVRIDGLRVEFSRGWGLVRASNTTPHLTLRFEAEDKKSLAEIKAAFREQLSLIQPGLWEACGEE